MQNIIHARTRRHASAGVGDVALDELEARPLRGRDERFDVVEVRTFAGGEVVEADDALVELEQHFQKIRADETGAARDEVVQG